MAMYEHPIGRCLMSNLSGVKLVGAWARRRAIGVVGAFVCGLLSFACAATPPLPVSDLTAGEGSLLPARVRRLSNIELERSVHALVDMDVAVASRLPPDVRQNGYTLNAQQSTSPTEAVRWSALAEEIARDVATRDALRLVPCDQPACSEAFIVDLSRRAWRRPATQNELASLSALFEHGRAMGGAAAGVEVTFSAVLQSPSFLYVTELGSDSAAESPSERPSAIQLTPYEIASALSYTLSGGPPDDALLTRADRGELADAEVRRAEARRILGRSFTRHHFRRFVLEWLEVDQLENTAKNPDLHPKYERLKSHMLAETRAYIDEVMVNYGASIEALLIGGFASVDPSMARYYGLNAFGPVVPLQGTGRVGVLQQASFLAMHSHPDTTSPILRGDFVLRKVLCKEMPRPSELGIEVVMPTPDPEQSTRKRFEQHAADPECMTCHQTIDPIGYTFEGFDAAGRTRTQEGKTPVDTRTTLSIFGEKTEFTDSAQLSIWLAKHPRTRACFAKQAFRYFSAQSDPGTELAFARVVERLPPASRGNLIEMLVEYAGSELFVNRALTKVGDRSNEPELESSL